MVHTKIALYLLIHSHYPKICLPVRAGSDFSRPWKRLGPAKADSYVRISCTAALLQPFQPSSITCDTRRTILSSRYDAILSAQETVMDSKYPRRGRGCAPCFFSIREISWV